MRPRDRSVERTLALLASGAHGVHSRSALLAAGLSPEEVRRRVRRSSLLPVHRGVYRVGHRAASVEAGYLAATLAAGDGAVLSGRAAGYLLGILRGPAPPPEVIALTEQRIPGVRIRRARGTIATEATLWRGMPVTTVARTLVDLARELDEGGLALAAHEAEIRFGTHPAEVEAALASRPCSAGAERLRRVVHGDVAVTLSRLESRFPERLSSASLPLPVTDRPAGGRRVDCRWEAPGLTVELDSYRYHRSRHAWERDRLREREAYARGDAFRRYTYGDVFEDPAAMLAELRTLLSGPEPRSLS